MYNLVRTLIIDIYGGTHRFYQYSIDSISAGGLKTSYQFYFHMC